MNLRNGHSAPSERSLDIAFQLNEGRLSRARPCDDQEPKAAPLQGVLQNRTDSAANRIPHDGFSDRFTDGNANDATEIRCQRLRAIDGKHAARNTPAALTEAGKVRAAPQAGIMPHQTVRR
jgi:hypothetical protein